MRRTIYLQMLYIINMYRSWIVVDDGYGYRQSVVFRRDRSVPCVCHILRLCSSYKHNGYEHGVKWSISEYELDKAMARYRQKNHELKVRLKKGVSYLEVKDVESIIEIATYGLVKLELTELPLFELFKQY